MFSDLRVFTGLLLVVLFLFSFIGTGCRGFENHYLEDGPAALDPLGLESPSSTHVFENHAPAELGTRDWQHFALSAEPSDVLHGPLYMENPFVVKGHATLMDNSERDPIMQNTNLNHLTGVDWIAMPYNYARFTLNWLASPISMIVTPPWTTQVSDGVVSRQLLGYDHDAIDIGAPDETLVNLPEAPVATDPESPHAVPLEDDEAAEASEPAPPQSER